MEPLKKAILAMVRKASELASKNGNEFRGISMHEIQHAFAVNLGFKPEMVRDHVASLVKNGFLERNDDRYANTDW